MKKRGGTSRRRKKSKHPLNGKGSLGEKSNPESSSSPPFSSGSSREGSSGASPSVVIGPNPSSSSSSSSLSGVASSEKKLLYGYVCGFKVAVNDPLLPRLNRHVSLGTFSDCKGIKRRNGPVLVEYLVDDNFKHDLNNNIRYREDIPCGPDGPYGGPILYGSGLIDIGWIISDLKARVEELRKSSKEEKFNTSDGYVKRGGECAVVAIHFIRYPTSTCGPMGNVAFMFTNIYPNTFFYSAVNIIDDKMKLQLSAWNGCPINDKREGIAKAYILIENINACLSTLILTNNSSNLNYLYSIKSNVDDS